MKIYNLLAVLIASLLQGQTYKISIETSGPIVGVGAISAFAAYELKFKTPKPVYQVESNRTSTDPFFQVKPLYSFEKISMVLVGGTALASGIQALNQDGRFDRDGFAIGTMALEIALLNHTSYGFYKSSGVHSTPESKHLNPFITNSLASNVGALSFFSAQVLTDLNVVKKNRGLLWGGAFLTTATATYLQYQHTHNIKDALVGSAIGSLMGFVVPILHRKNSRWEFYPNYNQYGFGIGVAKDF